MERLLLVASVFVKGTVQAQTNWGNVGEFGLGFLSAVVIHETGHAAVTYAVGVHMQDYGFQHMTSDTTEPAKPRPIALGGYMAQTLASDVVLQHPIVHDNPYALGIMAMGIYDNLSNVIGYYVFDNQANDLALYAGQGGGYRDGALFAVCALSHQPPHPCTALSFQERIRVHD